ncbi:MAG: hypothetical protein RDU14_12970 [Melioribacteraceae bacterium]|nr:hypothetical protein [Melioribacteraceae bacterium]
MKNKSLNIIPLILLFTTLSYPLSVKEKTVIKSSPYFPVNNGITLVYKSSFGETITNYFQDGEFIISDSKGDKFKYIQTLLTKEDGVYVQEIYQYFKIFLFIKKEATFTYEKPLLRFPLPLLPGMEWEWEGDEYLDGDTNKVKVTGKAHNKEFVITKAGRFEAIRIESLVEGTANSKNNVTEWFVEDVGLIKAKIIIEGGGLMGFLRDLLGYGTIEFELVEIKKQ